METSSRSVWGVPIEPLARIGKSDHSHPRILRHNGHGVTMERHTMTFFVSCTGESLALVPLANAVRLIPTGLYAISPSSQIVA
jgi:hypothetical protein